MSGIAGWIDLQPDPREEGILTVHMETMASALLHRGRGSHAIWACRRAALAQLPGPSVFSVPFAGRPCAVVCDTLLTSTAPLRRQLIREGYAFQGESDAELILAAYLIHGEDCVKLLNGCFAFLVWDGALHRAFAARDAFGTRPLFYAPIQGGMLLASEIKGLFAPSLCKPTLDSNSLCEVLGIGPGRTPGCGVFQGVRELPPGTCLWVNGGGPQPRTWYRLRSREHTDGLEDTLDERTRHLLLSSIRQQWPKDGNACALLSGGVDSSIITAVLANSARDAGRKLSTYSFDYPDSATHFHATAFQPESDAPYAEKMRAYCDTSHQILICSEQDLADALTDAMRARDLPGMADVDASLLHFCRLLAKEQNVVFSGECADEIFGGYPWFHREEFFAAKTFPWNTGANARMRTLHPDLLASLALQEHVHQRYEEMLAQVPRIPGESAQEARRREICYMNLYGFMQTLIERGDRMSASAGIDIRTPFCEPALIEYVFNTPWHFKLLSGEPKGLLRTAFNGLLPPDVLHRRKSPYPKTHNPIYEQMMQAQVREVLADPNAPVRTLLDVQAVMALCGERADYGQPWFGQLMAGPQLLAWILQLNAWLTEYKLSV